jgi:hypothetical protein
MAQRIFQHMTPSHLFAAGLGGPWTAPPVTVRSLAVVRRHFHGRYHVRAVQAHV